MAADLFYFISSLPTLRWGEKAPFTYRQFMDRCRVELGESASEKLSKLRLMPMDDQEKQSGIPSKWHEFEAFVRNTVADMRRARLRKGTAHFVRRDTSWLSPGDTKRIEDIMAIQSPLERENALDLFRWKYLDDISSSHFFDFSALEVYAIRLLLQEKQAFRQLEPGRTAFMSMIEDGLKKARERRVELN